MRRESGVWIAETVSRDVEAAAHAMGLQTHVMLARADEVINKFSEPFAACCTARFRRSRNRPLGIMERTTGYSYASPLRATRWSRALKRIQRPFLLREAGAPSWIGRHRAKGGDQGECEPAKHVPDAEPHKRVTGAGAHTANICRYDPR
jgi:hypothetical protein